MRFFSVQYSIWMERLSSLLTFRDSIVKHLSSAQEEFFSNGWNVVVFPDYLGLLASLVGKKGERARGMGTLRRAMTALVSSYSVEASYYDTLFPGLPIERLLLLAMTDTMAKAFLDTDLITGFLRGDADSEAKMRELEETGEQLKVTSTAACELLKGASSSAERESNVSNVQRLLRAFMLVGLAGESCEAAASVHADLRRKGPMIGKFDILIAGTVIASGDRLITRDRHFASVKGLELEEW